MKEINTNVGTLRRMRFTIRVLGAAAAGALAWIAMVGGAQGGGAGTAEAADTAALAAEDAPAMPWRTSTTPRPTRSWRRRTSS